MVCRHLDPVPHVAILLAAGDIDLQRMRDPAGQVGPPIGARLLIMGDAVRLQHAADLDGARHVKGAVGVDHGDNAGAQRARHNLDNRLGAAGPFIPAAPAFGADAELEGVKTMRVTQPAQPVGLVLGRDVALHRRGIGSHPPGRAANQAGDRLSGQPAQQVPQRGIDAGKRPPHIGARKFMLAFMDKGGKVQKIGHRVIAVNDTAEDPGRDLPVQHLRRDVGMIGRHLAPSGLAAITGHPHEPDIGGRKCLQP